MREKAEAEQRARKTDEKRRLAAERRERAREVSVEKQLERCRANECACLTAWIWGGYGGDHRAWLRDQKGERRTYP